MGGPAIRVFLVDDHDLVRVGLRSILSQRRDIEVVADSGDARQALRLLASGKERIDVLLADVALPGLNGLELCREVRESFPRCAVVMLSMHANEEYVLRALRYGASGYVLKNSSPPGLPPALRVAPRGGTSPRSAAPRENLHPSLERVGERDQPLDALTARQREILQLVAEGLTTREIAARLHLSVKTVESHRSNLMKRLGIRDLAGLVRFAIHNRMVIPDRDD